MDIRITRFRPDVEIPAYQTNGSAGMDLATAEETRIPPKTAVRIPTGLGIGVPKGYALFLFARSSLFIKKGLMLANSVGVLDSDYCGPKDEIQLAVWNPSEETIELKKGERIAQGVIMPVVQATLFEALANGPSRGGFGSTG